MEQQACGDRSLLAESPQEFRGGDIRSIIQSINGGLQAIGLALLVLFSFMRQP